MSLGMASVTTDPVPAAGPDAPRRIRVMDLEADLLRRLTEEDRLALGQASLPVVDVSGQAFEVSSFLAQRRAFAAVLVEGMVMFYLQIGAQPGLRLLGAGEVMAIRETARSPLLAHVHSRAAPGTRLALLGNDFLALARRVPRLMVGIHVRLSEQMERLATQLVICQLPRVGDRLLAMLWLLAESWGRVTPSGTTLPLTLTHETLGALVGARRPTVTLALGELIEQGALMHREGGWLLLAEPDVPSARAGKLDEPRLLAEAPSPWMAEEMPDYSTAEALAALHGTVDRLREQHLRNAAALRERLADSHRIRLTSVELRMRIALQREG